MSKLRVPIRTSKVSRCQSRVWYWVLLKRAIRSNYEWVGTKASIGLGLSWVEFDIIGVGFARIRHRPKMDTLNLEDWVKQSTVLVSKYTGRMKLVCRTLDAS